MVDRTIRAKPFIKWAGGKTQLLDQFVNYYPRELKEGKIRNYIEPFLGSGAVFLHIVQQYQIESAYLFDVNRDLILTYLVIQQRPEDLLTVLEQYQKNYEGTPLEKRRELFLAVRQEFNRNRTLMSPPYHKVPSDNWIARAAQFIFLNKTCYNGLFRLNSKGEFNVPYGRYDKPRICDPTNIYAVARALRKAEIHYGIYSDCFNLVTADSFVYFDPPYRPISQTANFTTYTGTEFTDKEQLELAKFFRKLDQTKGAKLMLSNSDPKNENPQDNFFEEVFCGYNIFRVHAARAVNSKSTKRGKIHELLITNYDP
ncbi:MAG: DNA adenine methylase [Pseudanabaenaceae cyanobacterium SKYGB_i_bin29]|nr:DNA adenine methylase [Pseudanabaenaceae cyanobacterium SKYG29]MDW8421533.1 DNA adenine methylase [Pseudanabaenaceae cyanobacterium SKYGB_i_bin29]